MMAEEGGSGGMCSSVFLVFDRKMARVVWLRGRGGQPRLRRSPALTREAN